MAYQDQNRTLGTIERAGAVIDTIQELDGARVSELADHLDLSPSTVHAYLTTLEQARYLVKEGDEYHIGLRFLSVGGYASNRKTGYQLAKQKVRDLAEKTGERAQFIVEEHGRGIQLQMEASDSAVQTDARVGKETYLHASAAGKSILANLGEERVDEIVDRWGLPALTENTITDREKLAEELELIRGRRYSFNKSESIEGLHAVGVPIKAHDDAILGALSVSGPANRLEGDWFEDEIPHQLLGVANEIKLNIKYP